MLNVFPDLLTYGLFAPLIIRLVLGGFILWRAQDILRQTLAHSDLVQKITTGLLLISAVFIVIGLFTQIAALAILLLSIASLSRKESAMRIVSLGGAETWLTLFVLASAFSLMLSGAGFYAIDLPL